jgi:TRAP-type uncharacterized transport system substrate-binding protein
MTDKGSQSGMFYVKYTVISKITTKKMKSCQIQDKKVKGKNVRKIKSGTAKIGQHLAQFIYNKYNVQEIDYTPQIHCFHSPPMYYHL